MTMIPKTSGCVKGFARQQRCFGRAGLPAAWLNQLYADYQELGSLELVGLKHGRSRQSVYQIFKRAGLKRNPRPDAKPVVFYNGRKYSQDSCGYWRDTVYRGTRASDGITLLHHAVWIAHRGPIPAGHDVGFKDGDRNHWQIENLECLAHGEMTRRRATGENQFTRSAAARTQTLLQTFNRGGRTVAAQLQNRTRTKL